MFVPVSALAREALGQIRRGRRPLPPQSAPASGGDTLEEERREVLDAALAALRSARSAADVAAARRLIEHLAAQPGKAAISAERRSR